MDYRVEFQNKAVHKLWNPHKSNQTNSKSRYSKKNNYSNWVVVKFEVVDFAFNAYINFIIYYVPICISNLEDKIIYIKTHKCNSNYSGN